MVMECDKVLSDKNLFPSPALTEQKKTKQQQQQQQQQQQTFTSV